MKFIYFENLPLHFCFYTLIMHQLVCAEMIELFKGQLSLRQYLQNKLCKIKSFVLVKNFRFDNEVAAVPNTSVQPKIDQVLKQSPNCEYGQLDNVDMRQLKLQLPNMELFAYFRTKQFIFDLSNFRITDRSTFAKVLRAFGQLYEHCSTCTPILVLFDHSLGPQRLFEWSMFAQSLVSSMFQSALIADLDSTMVTVLWRPVLDGCRSTEPIFWPRSVSDFARLNVHFRDCNLHSITLNVSVNQYMPICGFTHDPANNQLIERYSVKIEVLKVLAKQYNFKYRLVDGKQMWGMLDPVTGKWSGVIGHVVDGVSDMAMCDITRTISRYSVVDFTRHTLNIGVTFISHRPMRLDAAQLIAPTLFTATWYGLVAAFFLLVFMLYAILRQSYSYGCVLHMFFAITMRQTENSFISMLRTDSTRLLCASWLITVLIVYNFYGSIISSLLTISAYESAIDTIDDLVREANADRYQIVVARDTSYHQRFMQSAPEDSVLYAIGRHINRTMPNSLLEPDENIIKCVEQNSKRICISSRYYLANQRNTKATKSLYIGSDDIWKTTAGVVLPKRSPLLYAFNHVILKLREHGNFIYWLRRTGAFVEYESVKDDLSIIEEIKAISVQDIAWLFKLFLFVYPICAIVLLIENGVKRW